MQWITEGGPVNRYGSGSPAVRRETPAPGCLVQVSDYPGAAITTDELGDGCRGEPTGANQGNRASQPDRLRLDVRVEGAEQQGAAFETLTIEGEAVRERRIARRGKLVQRDIPQVRINRSEFLARQNHHTSPQRFSGWLTALALRGTARTSPFRKKTSDDAACITGMPPVLPAQRPKPYKDSPARSEDIHGRSWTAFAHRTSARRGILNGFR